MEPIKTPTTNCILKGRGEDNVIDLPVTRINFQDGIIGVESCWHLSPEELEEVKRTGNIYLVVLAHTHPPVCLSTTPSITTEEGGGE